MKIGVIGKGRIGNTLGKVWIAAGHEVMFGVRNPSGAAGDDQTGRVGTIEEAVEYGDVILFAIPGRVMVDTVKRLHVTDKIVLDATNGGGSPDAPVVRAIADLLPQCYVYKAFNTLGFENFQNPLFGDERADMMFIGPAAQQETVAGLIADVGLHPVYVGGLDQTAVLDAALALWFALSRQFGRRLAFRVLHDGR
jgi:predicted dinucleotide-binding enzyme